MFKLRHRNPPPEPIRLPPVIQAYNIDAILRGYGDHTHSSTVPIHISSEPKEQLPYGQWRCDYCAHVNLLEMVDCHYCGAKKSIQHTQDVPFSLHHNLQYPLT